MSWPRLSVRVGPTAPEDDLTFARQLGAECVFTWVPEDRTGRRDLETLKRRVVDQGLELYNVGCFTLGKNDRIHLALEGRDEAIGRFQEFVGNLGRAGIKATTFTWEPDGVWSSEPRDSRGARARTVDLDELALRPPTHRRIYQRAELWDNYAYFMERMVPVLKDAGVRLALHPNDPPTERTLGGIPCLIHNAASYERAFSFAPADVLGMEFCTGCWLEGGREFGDVEQGIRRFVHEKRIILVHFRNVSASLPRFTETFLDNGYADMYPLMRALCAAGYGGTVTLDHTPRFAEPFDAGGGTAYAIGYMRALLERARAELQA